MSDIKDIKEYARNLAHYLPQGKLWTAKNIEGTNFYNLLLGLAEILRDTDILIENFKDQFFPQNTTDFIEEWEAAVGIPDGCLKVASNIETRRINVLGKLASMGAVTEEHWINIATVMGLEITIEAFIDVSVFPDTFPIFLSGPPEEDIYITLITIVGGDSDVNVFPYTLPLTFEEDITSSFKCIINSIKPAHVNVIYQ